MKLLGKIIAARLDLQNRKIKHSGYNEYSDYTYYELSDFLPIVNELSRDLGFFCMFRCDEVKATLTIINTDDMSDQLIFECPMSSAKLKASHEVKNLGAVQTYLKRYLYQHAFEIVESDVIDASHDASKETRPRSKMSIIEALQSELSKALTDDDVINISSRFSAAIQSGKISVTEAEASQAKTLINLKMDKIGKGDEK